MSDKWAYDPEKCNGPCPGDCDKCHVPEGGEHIPREDDYPLSCFLVRGC